MLDQAPQSVIGSNNPPLTYIIQQLTTLDPTQLAWVSGYSWALSQQNTSLNNGDNLNGVNGISPPETLAPNVAIDAVAPAEERRILIL